MQFVCSLLVALVQVKENFSILITLDQALIRLITTNILRIWLFSHLINQCEFVFDREFIIYIVQSSNFFIHSRKIVKRHWNVFSTMILYLHSSEALLRDTMAR